MVHVVHKKPQENISKAQVQSQITALNQDFRATNPDVSQVPDPWKGLVADAKITFKLATKDPDGKRPTASCGCRPTARRSAPATR